MELAALALNCSLKRSGGEASSTQRLLDEVMAALGRHGVADAGTVRLADRRVLPGVTSDEGEGDEWPPIRARLLEARILVLGTPIWLGNPSSLCRRVLERLDAFLSETDEEGRTPAFGRVALAAVVGNEDGAHNACAQIYQGLNDVGFSLPPQAGVYWVGEAMQTVDYRDLESVPDKLAAATAMAAAGAAHLARLLAAQRFPQP